MAEKLDVSENQEAKEEEIHTGQIWFDKFFFLLALSIIITGLIYNAWGLWELFK